MSGWSCRTCVELVAYGIFSRDGLLEVKHFYHVDGVEKNWSKGELQMRWSFRVDLGNILARQRIMRRSCTPRTAVPELIPQPTFLRASLIMPYLWPLEAVIDESPFVVRTCTMKTKIERRFEESKRVLRFEAIRPIFSNCSSEKRQKFKERKK
ncbi:hypothetical protein AB6A40_009008 [Gnathostoma spinigerum]|uniref:Uncharacterized protein n=1 Tax=Gnathostoma spinigerum TaxID=75299 RepID=A0ABD6EVT6_9BILA